MHQSTKAAETFKDFKAAKEKGIIIVSPHWLQAVLVVFYLTIFRNLFGLSVFILVQGKGN